MASKVAGGQRMTTVLFFTGKSSIQNLRLVKKKSRPPGPVPRVTRRNRKVIIFGVGYLDPLVDIFARWARNIRERNSLLAPVVFF